MAITFETTPSLNTGAFGKNIIIASSDDTELKRLIYNLRVGGNAKAVQYAPIFSFQGEFTLGDPQGTFTINGLYSSMLPLFNNPIKDVTANFTQIDAYRHQLTINDRVIEDKIDGATLTTERRIYKAVTTKFGESEYWVSGGSVTFMAFTRKNNSVIRHVFDGQLIPISYYNDSPTTGRYIQLINAGGNSNIGLTNINQRFRVATWKVNSTYNYNTLNIANATVPLEIVIDRKKYPRPKTLYFLNRFGGWEWYNFTDYEATNISDKHQLTKYTNMEVDTEVLQYVTGQKRRYKLFGVEGSAEYVYYIKDLISSPIVLDEKGERVRVLDNSILFEEEEMISPEITIEYIEENVINY